MKVYGVIEVGSYGVSLEIYEISRKFGIKRIDQIRYPLEVGVDTYTNGKISRETVDSLCRILQDFSKVLKGYQISEYRAVTTTAFREASNASLAISQIRQRTGIALELFSNSELRFLSYKAIASRETDFEQIIQKGTAIVDVGGGSMQLSLFDKDNLISTQNLPFGNLRIRERLAELLRENTDLEYLIREMIWSEVDAYRKMHLKDRKTPHVILTGDFISDFVTHHKDLGLKSFMSREEFGTWYDKAMKLSPYDMGERLGIRNEYIALLKPTMILYKEFVDAFEAEMIWIPGVGISNGFAYDYAEKQKMISNAHNFENDILMAARNIGKRYAISKAHIQSMDMAALAVFDSMKKIHGLGKRERLLLEIAVHLHDCGKYISMSRVGDCSYEIIMATEIIGLSHAERKVIALTVRYNTKPFDSYEDMDYVVNLSEEEYLLVAKLTAILRLANALDRSHKEKLKDLRVVLQDEKLVIRLATKEDFTLEKGLLKDKQDFFEEVFNVRPVIRLKKLI